MAEGIPWLTFAATRFLERHLHRGMRVFEYGSGGSTVFLAQRVASVVSVEHDAAWADSVRAELARQRLTNCTHNLIPPTPSPTAREVDNADPAGYISSDDRYTGQSFQQYVSAIDEYGLGHFDLVLVDGRARPSCLVHAAKSAKPSGCIMLDNSESANYQRAVAWMNTLRTRQIRLAGPIRSCWRRPS